MRQLSLIAFVLFSLVACNNSTTPKEETTEAPQTTESTETTEAPANPSYDPERGIGKFTNVEVSDKLNKGMADAGKIVYDVKCASCHKLTDERLVGPGWKGVTKRYRPEWIMNFSTNPDEMLDKDPKAQAQLEICLVRMPNQSLTDDNARHVLEFMRENDGVK
jgi:cytochrome c551/c552